MVQLGNTERRPKKSVLCTSAKECLMYVLKRTSYVRPEKDVFYTYLWNVQKTSFYLP